MTTILKVKQSAFGGIFQKLKTWVCKWRRVLCSSSTCSPPLLLGVQWVQRVYLQWQWGLLVYRNGVVLQFERTEHALWRPSEEEDRQREPPGHMTDEVNVHAGKEKEKRNNLFNTFSLSLPLSVLPPPPLSHAHTHTHTHTSSLTPSSSQWRPWEESRYEASLRHTREKDMLALHSSPLVLLWMVWGDAESGFSFILFDFSLSKVTISWFELWLSSDEMVSQFVRCVSWDCCSFISSWLLFTPKIVESVSWSNAVFFLFVAVLLHQREIQVCHVGSCWWRDFLMD